MPESITIRSDRVGLLTPVVWSDPKQFENWNYSAIKNSFVTLAEFYLAYADEAANCVKQDGWLCLMHSLGKGEQDPVLQKQLQAYRSAAKKLRGLTYLSLAIGAFGLKTPLKHGVLRILTVAAVVNVAFGLILCCAKIYLHATRHPCKMGFAQRKVDAWLAIPKGQCKRGDLMKECEPLSDEENWEFLQYAVSLMNSRLDKLSDNIRLIWIIADNLEILRDQKKVGTVSGLGGILPPDETQAGLRNLMAAIQKEEKPSQSLESIKDKLSSWEDRLSIFEGVKLKRLPITKPQLILEGIGTDLEFIAKMIPADKQAAFIGKLNGPGMSKEEIKTYLVPNATKQDVEQAVKLFGKSNAPILTPALAGSAVPVAPAGRAAPVAPAAPSIVPSGPPVSPAPD